MYRTQICPRCEVTVRGDKIICPLCGNTLPEAPQISTLEKPVDVFPYVEPAFHRNLALRILVFISVVAVILAFAVSRFFETDINWPLLLLLGIISMWVIASNVLRKHRSIAKVISWQVTLLSALALIWDWTIGWQGWSLGYAIPITCTAAVAAMFVIAKVRHLEPGEYLVYLALCAVFGLLPFIFLLFGWTGTALPSLISVVVSASMLAAVLVFQWETIWSELQKRLHI